MSPRLFRATVRSGIPLLAELAGASDEPGESTGPIDRLLARLAKHLSSSDRRLAFSASNDEGGLLTVSRLPFPGKYLDDIFLGDMLYDDPKLLDLMTMDDEGRDQFLDQAPEANAALAENARHYRDQAEDIIDRDSLHSQQRCQPPFPRPPVRPPALSTASTQKANS